MRQTRTDSAYVSVLELGHGFGTHIGRPDETQYVNKNVIVFGSFKKLPRNT